MWRSPIESTGYPSRTRTGPSCFAKASERRQGRRPHQAKDPRLPEPVMRQSETHAKEEPRRDTVVFVSVTGGLGGPSEASPPSSLTSMDQ